MKNFVTRYATIWFAMQKFALFLTKPLNVLYDRIEQQRCTFQISFAKNTIRLAYENSATILIMTAVNTENWLHS